MPTLETDPLVNMLLENDTPIFKTDKYRAHTLKCSGIEKLVLLIYGICSYWKNGEGYHSKGKIWTYLETYDTLDDLVQAIQR
jgi:predicted membrane protein